MHLNNENTFLRVPKRDVINVLAHLFFFTIYLLGCGPVVKKQNGKQKTNRGEKRRIQ